MTLLRSAAMLGLFLAACRGGARAARDGAAPPAVATVSDAAPPDAVAEEDDGTAELDVGDSEAAALRQAGAISAWRGVVERSHYLARRGQRGALYGRLVTAAGGARWLVDETEGDGALGARVDLGGASGLADGDRLVAWGAWSVVLAPGTTGRWIWTADEIARLPAKPPPAADGYAATTPGHDIESVEHLAEPATVVESVTRHGGGIVFEVVSRPRHRGDGWTIAGRSRWPAAAILYLPGDEESYGGQDLRADSERWKLAPKVRYVARVARWRPPRHPGELPVLRAISPPKKLIEAAK